MKVCAILILASACVTPPHASPASVAMLRESPEATLEVCKYLGRYAGSSSLPGEKGQQQAREDARLRAAEAGATNFFYDAESASPDSARVSVKGYDCGRAP